MIAGKRLALGVGVVLGGALLVAFVAAHEPVAERARAERAEQARSPSSASGRSVTKRRPRRYAARAATGPTRPASASTPTETAARAAPPGAQPPAPSRRAEQLATTVLQQAVRGDWLSTDDQGTPCAPDRVRIVYDAPAELAGYENGAYFEPLGPAPDDRQDEVNGLLLCEGSTFLYRGFEAYFRSDRGQWDVYPFPVIE